MSISRRAHSADNNGFNPCRTDLLVRKRIIKIENHIMIDSSLLLKVLINFIGLSIC